MSNIPMYDDLDSYVYYDVVAEALDPEFASPPDYFCGLVDDLDPDIIAQVAEYLAQRDRVPTIVTCAFGAPKLVRRMPNELSKYWITHCGLIYHQDNFRINRNRQIVAGCIAPTVPDHTGMLTVPLKDVYGQVRSHYVHNLIGSTYYNITHKNAIFMHLDDDLTFNHFQNIGVACG